MEPKFNPSSPEYKKVEDLPQEHQAEFVDVEGGFVKKEAVETMSESEKLAAIANVLGKERVTGMDVMYGKALGGEENKQREKNKALKLVEHHGYWLKDVSEELRNDKEVVLAAVKNKGGALKHASERFRNDKEVVLAAVNQAAHALKYASEEIRNDKEVVLVAVKNNGSSLEYASEDLKNDKEVVLTAVKNFSLSAGYTVRFASKEIKKELEKLLGGKIDDSDDDDDD